MFEASKLLSTVSGAWQPYGSFDRERLADYIAIRHFGHAVEGSYFILFAGQNPLTYAMHARPDRYFPQEVKHLE